MSSDSKDDDPVMRLGGIDAGPFPGMVKRLDFSGGCVAGAVSGREWRPLPSSKDLADGGIVLFGHKLEL